MFKITNYSSTSTSTISASDEETETQSETSSPTIRQSQELPLTKQPVFILIVIGTSFILLLLGLTFLIIVRYKKKKQNAKMTTMMEQGTYLQTQAPTSTLVNNQTYMTFQGFNPAQQQMGAYATGVRPVSQMFGPSNNAPNTWSAFQYDGLNTYGSMTR